MNILLAAGDISAEWLGYLVIGIFILVSGGTAIKNFFTPTPGTEAIQRKDYDILKRDVELNLNSIIQVTNKLAEYVTRNEFTILRNELMAQVDKIDQYSRAHNLKLSEKVSELQLSIESVHRNIQVDINAFVIKLLEKHERTQTSVTELRTLIDKRMPIINNKIEGTQLPL